MRYPALTQTKCAELTTQRVDGDDPSVDPHVNWLGQGDEIDLRPITVAAAEIDDAKEHWSDSDKDRFEGRQCSVLAAGLAHVPTEILDDAGFWRFLAIRYFWDFIAWRESKPFASGNYMKYVDAKTNTESVLPRMYLRARATGGDGQLAGSLTNATDFWRSHVIRVRTGTAPAIARAFAEQQGRDRLMTDSLRETAKRLNRMWTNIVLHVYDSDEARTVVEEIWNESADD